MQVRKGGFSLWVDSNRILYASVRGIWSASSAHRFVREFKKAAAPLLETPWAHIVLLDEWELGTPDIEPVISELVDWCIANNLKRSAQVYENSGIKAFQLDQMVPFVKGDFIREHFMREKDALEWLKVEGFVHQTRSDAKV